MDAGRTWGYPIFRELCTRTFNFVVERDPDTGTYVGYVPGWPGAHTQGDTLDELQINFEAGRRPTLS
jgi:hypothetical protein